MVSIKVNKLKALDEFARTMRVYFGGPLTLRVDWSAGLVAVVPLHADDAMTFRLSDVLAWYADGVPMKFI